VFTLGYLFEGRTATCEKALDSNDNGHVDVSDSVQSLLYLFRGASRLPEPFLGCGIDPTEDGLSCTDFPICGPAPVSPPVSTPPFNFVCAEDDLSERQGSYRWSYRYGEGRTSLVQDATRCAAMIDPSDEAGRGALEAALEKVGGFAPLQSRDAQEYPGLWYPRFLETTREEDHRSLIEELHEAPGIVFAAPLLIYGTAVAIPRPEILVTFDADAQEEDVLDLLAQPDLRLIREFPAIDTTLHFAFDGSPAECFARCDELSDLETVSAAEPNMIWNLRKMAVPNDPLHAQQWDLNNTGQTGGTPGADMRAHSAWDVSTGSSSIVVAICDEGVDVDHPDLAANMVAGRDSVTADSTPPADPGDAENNDAHGTACAGIVAAVGNNGIGLAGINWNAKIMPIRLGFGNFWTANDWIIDAVTWATDNGADVQSHSWGGGAPSASIENAFVYATTTGRGGLGASCFAASGNNNSSVSYPAAYDSTIAVGATSPCDERKSPSSCDGETWWGSNFGPELDLCAPGPLVTTTDIAGGSGYSGGDYVNNFNGTSSATPHAAGAGALLLSVQSSLTALEVRQIMQESADDQVGIPSEDTPGKDNFMGWGRVNLSTMLSLVAGGVPRPTGLTCTESGSSVVLAWTNADNYSSIIVARNGTTIATLPGSTDTYTDTAPGIGNVTHSVTATLDGNASPQVSCSAFLSGGATDLVFAPSQASGATNGGQGLYDALIANGRLPLLVDSLDAVASLDAFEALWVNLGMYPNNHVLTAPEGALLDSYLTNETGGSFLYLEGGDTWAYDPATAVHARFGILGVSDGTGDLSTIGGVAGSGCDLSGSSWSYSGENSWVDHLVPSGTGVVTLTNATQSYDIGIFNDAGTYRSFGTSFEIGGIGAGGATATQLVAGILQCFAGAPPPPPPPAAPVAGFTSSPASGEAPLLVSFTDTSTGVVDSWAWDFGDGAGSSLQNPSHTYDAPGTYTVTLTVANSGGSDSAACVDCVTVTEEPTPDAPKIYISFKGTAQVPGVGTVRDEDIVSYDPNADSWSMHFDGSDVGIASTDVDAFSIRADGSIVISFNSSSFSVPGLVGGPTGTTVDDSDLILFTPSSTGLTTAGTFTFLFDGSDVGLTSNGEDIDGVCWLDDDTFLFSTQGSVSGSGPTMRDEDVGFFVPSSLGSATSGSWQWFFDGSDVGYADSRQEDIDSFTLDFDQSLLLSTVGFASPGTATGDDEDIFRFSGVYGQATSGTTTLEIVLSSLGIDSSEDVDGISIR